MLMEAGCAGDMMVVLPLLGSGRVPFVYGFVTLKLGLLVVGLGVL